ncbi:MAG: hypothetical protein JSS49_19170 [Planctomycetes bacterium]|nr:hypothetical protein [Planctomycetota bacterium]
MPRARDAARSRNRRASASRSGMLAAVVWLASISSVLAQPVDLTTELSEARRIFVPAEDLDVIVERDHRGAMLTRKKFDELMSLAKANAARATPQLPIVLTSSSYEARVAGDQLLLSVTAEMTQFINDWQSISFPMQRLAIEKATLDDEPAMLGRNQDGAVALLSADKGTHTLKLELSTELNSLGSDQVAGFSLLRAPSGTLSLTLPAGKRLFVGSLQLERPAPLEQSADYKVAIGGAPGVQLRITDRAAENAADALTFATTGYGLHVAPGEVTWHALTTLQIFGKPIDRLTFSVPSTLEIADIEATGLEAWDLTDDPNDKMRMNIALTFGQAFDGSRKISFKGVMAVETGQPWAVPPLSITNVTSHIGQVVVQHSAGVRLRIEETEGVRRATQGQKPNADMPDEMSKFNATEFLRFDVWQPAFVLRLTTQPKQREVQTAVAAVLDVNATGLDLQALLTVVTHFAPLFEVDVRLPADWTVLSAQRDDTVLKWQVLPQEAGINQLRILLEQPLAAEATGTIRLSLRREVEGWPVEAEPITVDLPELFLPQSSLNEGTFVVRGDDDLDLASLDLTGLDTMPLKADYERLRFQTQDTRYSGKLKVTRKPSRIAAQTITFGRLDPQTMHAFVQAVVDVQGGGVRTLKVALPESAGTALRFQSPVRQIVEQKPGTAQNGERIWTLQFDQRVRGILPLFCDIELPRGDVKEFRVPQARFVDAERQNGFQAVEASGEQRLTIDAKGADGAALVDVDPLDLPPVYYTPKERIVAVYRNVTAGATLTLSEERFDKLAVPTAICPMLNLTSVLGKTGELQHRADFQLTAVGIQGLRVTLPPKTLLWATLVDDKPVEVRHQGDIYLVPLNVVSAGTGQGAGPHSGSTRHLQLFYRSEVDALTQFGTIEQPPPELSVQTGQGTSQPVDVLDQHWELYYPSKTLLVGSDGLMEPEQKLDETSLLGRLNTGVRVPTLTELGWQAFSVIVTLGVIALLVLAYRKGRSIAVTGVCLLVGLLLWFALMLPMTHLPPHSGTSHRYGTGPAAMTTAPMNAKSESYEIADGVSATQSVTEAMPAAEDEMKEITATPPKAPPMPSDSPAAESALATSEKSEKSNAEIKRDREESSWKSLDDVEAMAQADADKPLDFGAPNRADIEGRRGKNGDGKQGMALLSLAIDLTPPEGSLQKSFRYAGADPARGGITLKLDYVDEHSGTVLRIFLVALVALIGWCLRGSSCLTKTALAAVGLTIPLALLPLAPQSLQVVLDGVFFGVIVTCALWLLMGIVRCLETCCTNCCGWGVNQAAKSGTTLGLWLLTVVMLSGNAFAQNGEPNQPNAQAPTEQPGGTPMAPPVKHEATLVVPFDAGTDPLAADEILLPFDKFVELYQQAYPDKAMRQTAPHPGGIVDALYAAKLIPNEKRPEESTIEVTARYAIRSHVDGQLQVELPVGEVAARQARLDGKTAALIVNGACSKVAISSPGLHIVDFVFSVPARLSGSTGSFTLPLLPAPSGKLSLVLPAKDLSVRINGSSTVFRRVTQADVQSIEVPIDKGGDLTIAWQPEQAKGVAAAVIHVDSVQAVTLTDAGIRVSTGFQYRIRQGGVADVAFSLPATYRLQAVNGSDVGGWELQGEGDARQLRVIFRRNITDTTQLTVEAFLDSKVGVETTVIDVPQLAPLQVTNEIGQLAVFAGNQFTIRADKVESLSQIDADKFNTALPVSRPNVPPQLAYRFSKRPFAFALRATRQESQANVVAHQAAFVTLRKQQLTTRLLYNLTGAPRSSFSIALPDGYVVLDVKATGLHDWSLGKQNDETYLTIDLNGPRLGLAEVVLSGTVPRDNGDVNASLVFPRPLDATRLNSVAAVWLDDGFTGTLDTFEGWRSVDAAHASPEVKAVRPNQPVQFAFQSSVATPSAITLNLQRATPKLTANGLTMVSVTDVSVIHTLALQWQIKTATTDSLVFTTPSFLAGKLEFAGDGIRETTHVDAGNDRTRWTIWLRTPIRGKYFAAAVGTMPPASTEVVAPSVAFEAVDSQNQYVLLINSSQSQLTSASPELTEAVQREDVPVVVDQSLVDQATELVRVKQLLTAPRWTVQTFAQTAGAPASVNVADLTTIVSRDGTYRGQAIYTIKNRSRQFLALKLPADTELMSVFVGNVPSRAVKAKRNNETIDLIALPKTSAASLSFPVRIQWRGRLGSSLPKSARLLRQDLDFPAPVVVSQQDDPDFGIPVARTRWTVWLPDDLDAEPLTSSARHNLTLQSSDQNDLLYEKAAMQELSELLGYVEQNYSFLSASSERRNPASNNLKQIGLAIQNARQLEQSVQRSSGDQDFDRQKGLALKRLSELEKSIQTDQQQAYQQFNEQVTRAIDSNGNGIQSGVVNQIDTNGATLILDNRFEGIEQKKSEGQSFNFELQNKDQDGEKAAEGKPSPDDSKPSSGKGGKGANLETRQNLQLGNTANIDNLNLQINQQKIAGQQGQQGQQGQGGFGGGQFGFGGQGGFGGGQFGGGRGGQQGVGQPAQSQSPLGGPASLQSHTVRNRTVNEQPRGVNDMKIDVQKDANGFLPPPVSYGITTAPAGEPPYGRGFTAGANIGVVNPGRPVMNPQDERLFETAQFGDLGQANNPRINDPFNGSSFSTNGGVIQQPLVTDGFANNMALAERGNPVVAAPQNPAFGPNAGFVAAGGQVGGGSIWSQSGGLSLGFELPTRGRKLVFSKAGGDPKLALAVRPEQSIRWGLNLVWSAVWLAIGLAVVLAVRSPSVVTRLSRQLPIGVAVLSVLAFIVLPRPLNGCAFVTFVIASLVVAWIHRQAPEAAKS